MRGIRVTRRGLAVSLSVAAMALSSCSSSPPSSSHPSAAGHPKCAETTRPVSCPAITSPTGLRFTWAHSSNCPVLAGVSVPDSQTVRLRLVARGMCLQNLIVGPKDLHLPSPVATETPVTVLVAYTDHGRSRTYRLIAHTA